MTTSVPSRESLEKLPALSVVSIKPTRTQATIAANAKTFNLTSSFISDINSISSNTSGASITVDDLLPARKKPSLIQKKQLSLDERELLRRLKDLRILSDTDSDKSRSQQNYEKNFKLDRDYQFGSRNEKRSLRTLFTDIELDSRFKLSDLFQINNEANSVRIDLDLSSRTQLSGVDNSNKQVPTATTDVKVSLLKKFNLMAKLNARLARVLQVQGMAKNMVKSLCYFLSWCFSRPVNKTTPDFAFTYFVFVFLFEFLQQRLTQ